MRTSWSLLPRSGVISCRTAAGDLSNHGESLHGPCSKPIGYRKRSGSGLIIIELAARTAATSPHTVGPIPQMRSSTHFKSGKLSRPTSPMDKILVSPSLCTLSITLGLNPQAPVASILVGRSHGRLIIWPPLIGTADTSIVNQPELAGLAAVDLPRRCAHSRRRGKGMGDKENTWGDQEAGMAAGSHGHSRFFQHGRRSSACGKHWRILWLPGNDASNAPSTSKCESTALKQDSPVRVHLSDCSEPLSVHAEIPTYRVYGSNFDPPRHIAGCAEAAAISQ